jgi:uncharacterized protein YjiS (DUF1127 family)
MKIISILRSLSIPTAQLDPERKAQWIRDPLAHPDLEAMSERELADLPFSRGSRADVSAEACRA